MNTQNNFKAEEYTVNSWINPSTGKERLYVNTNTHEATAALFGYTAQYKKNGNIDLWIHKSDVWEKREWAHAFNSIKIWVEDGEIFHRYYDGKSEIEFTPEARDFILSLVHEKDISLKEKQKELDEEFLARMEKKQFSKRKGFEMRSIVQKVHGKVRIGKMDFLSTEALTQALNEEFSFSIQNEDFHTPRVNVSLTIFTEENVAELEKLAEEKYSEEIDEKIYTIIKQK